MTVQRRNEILFHLDSMIKEFDWFVDNLAEFGFENEIFTLIANSSNPVKVKKFLFNRFTY